MEKYIKSFLFFKIATFILLTWIVHFNVDQCSFSKFLDESWKYRRKFYINTYRLLAKYKRDNASNDVGLKEEIPNHTVKEEKYVCNNGWGTSGKKVKSCKSSSMYVVGHKPTMKNKSNIFETKKYSHLEKKIFKELDYMDFLKNNRTLSERIYYKIIRKKYGLRIGLPLFLFLFLATSLILDVTCNMGLIKEWFNILNALPIGKWYMYLDKLLRNSPYKWFFQSMKKLDNVVKGRGCKARSDGYIYVSTFLGLFIYVIPFIILGITIILGIVYYHKKVKKYEKIKFRKR
ncbi:fam-l protein [Plasmodium malariae]|uniref:Fam-l protein n=1 Tax=Plasmodium malariae TaxID=5858 RepID=A0A1D3JIR5_PLAMA|nr:fam-l protein [Plasmodium malariae]SBT86377.1 fam-l protein [Plasmodium malariae]